MIMWTLFDVAVFGAGFAAGWVLKDKLIQAATGSEAFAKMLEAKVAALRAVL